MSETVLKNLHFLDVYAAAQTTSKSIQICATTVFFLYCASQINTEIAYIWKMPWTRGKAIYLLTRYIGALYLIIALSMDSALQWGEVGYALNDDEPFSIEAKGRCLGGYFFILFGALINLLTETIMAMRIFALYGGKKWTVVLSILLITISFLANQTLFLEYLATPAEKCISTPCTYPNQDFPFKVSASCNLVSSTISLVGWIFSFTVELIFVILVIRKTHQLKDPGEGKNPTDTHNCDIIGLMARDSKKYFILILVVYLLATCSAITLLVARYAGNPTTHVLVIIPGLQGNSILTIVVVATTILAPELLLNIRVEYYGPVGALTKAPECQLSWRAAESTVRIG